MSEVELQTLSQRVFALGVSHPVETEASLETASVTSASSEELQVPENAVSLEDVPPNGGYAWVCTACVFLINACTWGLNSAWGIFLAHYLSHSTFPGATQFDYALIGGLSISQALIVSPLTATINRLLGTPVSLFLGTILVFGSMLGASFATAIWHLYLSQGLCFGWGMGFLYVTATAVLPQWFSSRRSLAMGIATSGSGLGGLAFNLITGHAVETLGLQWAYRILAFCSLGINLVCSCLLKDRNKSIQPSQKAFNYREYARAEVLLIVFWGFFTELGFITLLFSLPSYASSIGLSASQGSVVGAVLNLGLGIGRPIVGYYSDSFGRINMASVTTATCGVLCLALWIPAKTYGVLVAFALLVGTVCGTFWGTVSPVTAEVVGLQRLPSSFGLICMSLVLPTTFAEAIALQLVASSSYLPSQVYVGCMFFAGALATWLLRCWKINEIEKKAETEVEVSASDTPNATGWSMWITPQKLFARGKF